MENKRVIETGIERRNIELDERSTIDEKARTVSVRFSSDYPVPRWVDGVRGNEILIHNRGAVDLGRLNDGGAVLMDHDDRDQVGVVESAEISETDKAGRAIIRFGKSTRASEVFQDVIDGIRRTFSVGYMVHKYVTEKRGEVVEHLAQKWEPYEITLTPVPADPTAQVGRDSDLKTQTEIISMEPEIKALSDAERNALIADTRKTEQNRVREITALGEKHGLPVDTIRKAIGDDTSVDAMTVICLDHISAEAERAGPVSNLGLSPNEIEKWSLLRALNAAYNGDWRSAGFEAECSKAIEDEVDRPARGFYIPWEIQTQRAAGPVDQSRVMTVGTAAAGGYLKGTDHLASSFIELLRSKTLLGSLGARFLPGLRGDVEIPRLDTGVAFYWVGEDVDGTLSDAVLGQVALTPRTVTGQVPISRKLLKQSAPSIEQLLLGDLAAGAAHEIDLKGFQGTGTDQPTGIMNQSGIGTTSIATFATTGYPTHAEMVAFETDVAVANADLGSLAYVTTAPIRGNMKTTPIDAGSGIMLSTNNAVNGYPLHVKTDLAAKTILYGNFQDVVIGMWGVLDVEPDKAAKAAAGGLVLRVFQDVDVAIRHAGSFSKATA